MTSSSHPVATTWYATREVAATFAATDASGIAGYAVALDQNATTIPDAVVTQTDATYTATLPSDGEWYLHVRAVDTRGNWGDTRHRLFRADTAAPVTTSDAAGPYTGSATITLTPTDPSPGSGVASTRWALDGGGSGTGTTINVAAEGDWTLRFSSADSAGNREETQTASFAVEIAPAAPVISSATHPDADAWYGDTDFEASWVASDTSGIAGYAVVFDQSASTVPAAVVTQEGSTYAATIPADGEWYLHVRAVDGRGNWSETAHRRVRVDSALPTLSAIASATHPVASTWYASRALSASWSASDTSGIAGYAVVLDQSASTVPAAVVTQESSTYASTLTADGEWYLHVRAVDNQGDWSGTQHRLVKADTAPPVTTSDAAGPYAGSATITLSPSDPSPGSGVASTHWSLDGGGSGTGTTVNVTAEGDWTLRFSSADVAGNREETQTATFAVEIPPAAP
ncbi:MAG: Ig-like domain repeat protein, partial [Actinomycetota bacterium]|nr:Ig-like domain repeat protein [Actinomycetota bacterium]